MFLEVAAVRNAIECMEALAPDKDCGLEADIAFYVAIAAAAGNRFRKWLEGIVDVAFRTSIQMTWRRRSRPIVRAKERPDLRRADPRSVHGTPSPNPSLGAIS
ncbi:DNA-binding FadR family transcriptional regulator [Povalibacter uvarum]|uniref:DNA-binding FadR family transcriptional regulator n=1 Tax=Povalibacter uvarum TaxID=732238 RepID=A0A841HN00_9GAMM|nr:FCD domain-containing protein [Povalibacter uvarum]MBB6093650.1 DNA-binding FadR family transcriptional regulator [Povalibacter uvarum]